MILTVTLNPSVDHALFIDRLKIGDTNRVLRTERDAGGKGVNLSRVVAELGGSTLATGFLGGGPGDYVRGVLDRQGVHHEFIDVAEETRINFSVEDGSGPPTTFNELGPQITPGDMDRLMALIGSRVHEVRWMALGGSLPPGAPQDVFGQLIRMARESGVKIALDADGEPLRHGIEAGPDFVKPNAKEAERILGEKVDSREAAARAASALRQRLGAFGAPQPCAVVSLGADGAAMACEEGVFLGQAPRVEARSTIGSGDSLIAGMLCAIEQGKTFQEAFSWGIACGAATATTNGSEIARRPVILELLPQVRIEPG